MTYCGVHGEQSLTEALMEKLAAQAGLTTTPLPTRVQLHPPRPVSHPAELPGHDLQRPRPARREVRGRLPAGGTGGRGDLGRRIEPEGEAGRHGGTGAEGTEARRHAGTKGGERRQGRE